MKSHIQRANIPSSLSSKPAGNEKNVEPPEITPVARPRSGSVTRRSQLWSKHASWQLPSVAREHLPTNEGIEHVCDILKNFEVDPFRGLIP